VNHRDRQEFGCCASHCSILSMLVPQMAPFRLAEKGAKFKWEQRHDDRAAACKRVEQVRRRRRSANQQYTHRRCCAWRGHEDLGRAQDKPGDRVRQRRGSLGLRKLDKRVGAR
jgi:hypothetical protein